MECKKCGNDEIDEFDVVVKGILGSSDSKVVRVCLGCDDEIEMTEEIKKEFKENEKQKEGEEE